MRNIISLLKKRLVIAFLLMSVILMSLPINAFADELSFAVSPSKIVDYRIEPGETKEIIFSVGNKSIFPPEHVDKNELYKFKIDVSATLEDSDGLEIDTKNIITFNKKTLECKPSEADKVTATISIPKDFERNAYKLYINFTRQPVEGIEDVQNTTYSVIKVPVFLFIGDESEFNKLKADYEVTKFYMDFGQNGQTFVKTITENLKELITLNPFKVIDTFKDIKHKPVHDITKNKGKENETLVVDVNNNLMVSINSVITNGKTNDWNYVSANEEQLNKNVANVNFKDNSVEFVLENKDIVVVEGTNKTVNFIKNQINNILGTIKGTPVLKDLFNQIKVPVNKNYDIFTYSAFIEVSNTGEKDVHVGSDLSLLKDNSTAMGEGILKPLTVSVGKSESINVPMSMNGSLTTGDYKLTGNFLAGKIDKTTDYDYQVDNKLSEKIFFTTLAIYLLIILLILLIIKVIIDFLRKYKKGYVKTVSIRKLTNEELSKLNLSENNKSFRVVVVDELNVRSKANNSSKMTDTISKGFIVELIEDNNNDTTEWSKIRYLISKKKKFNKK